LGSIYQAFKKGTKPDLPNLPMQYADYASWQKERLQGETYTRLKEYWFHKYQEAFAPLQLPADRFPTGQLAQVGVDTTAHVYKFNIGTETLSKLKQLAGQEKVSLFVTLLTTWNCLLYMYTKQEHFLIFTSVSAKNRPELKALIGLFSNLVPLQIKITQDQNLKQLIESVHHEVNDAVAHQDLSFDKITEFIKTKVTEQRMSYTSLFQVMFILRYGEEFEYNLGDIRLEQMEMALEKEFNFQLRLAMIEKMGHLECSLTYNAALFEESTVGQVVEHYLTLLESSLNAVELPILELTVFQSIEHHREILAGKRAAELKNVQITPYVAPRNEAEERMAAIWEEILGIKPIGIHDNFFELGGHSLKAVQMIAALKEYQIILADVFRYPTIALLSAHAKPADSCAGATHQPVEYSFSAKGIHAETYAIQAKRLEKITPFNEVLYKNCLYNALFPAVLHFGRDLYPVIANDLIRYDHEIHANELKLKIETISARPMMEVAPDLSLKLEAKTFCENIVADLIAALSNERPVCIAVDCYYEPIRFDTFQKQHWLHWILVYGYNLAEQTFDILEHSDLNSLDYAHRYIGFNDLREAYQGYLIHFQKGAQTPSYYEIHEDTVATGASADAREIWNDRNRYQSIFYHNFTVNHGRMLDGLDSLVKFGGYFQGIAGDETALRKKAPELMFQLNEVAKAKLTEKYALEKLFGETMAPLEQLKASITHWNTIRSVLDRYRVTGQYRPGSFQNACSKLTEIIELEGVYLEQLGKMAQMSKV
jgi:acyl carrier protein